MVSKKICGLTYNFFILLLFVLMYAYLFYPLILERKARSKKFTFSEYNREEDLPEVHIIIPLRNEEKVIEEKLNSIFQSDYPKEKLKVIIGLDSCTDRTKEIIGEFNFPNLRIVEFAERQGKPNVVNQIISQLPNDNSILILTDANIIFTPSTVFEMAKYFKDARIGMVDSNIQPKKITNSNEKDYWSYETNIKNNESIVYGLIPGPSGGCYAIRRTLFSNIPQNFLVDDFFIGFTIVTQGHNALLNMNAVCYEDVTTNWQQEFQRKVRIATGNFQNLGYFKKYIINSSPVGIVFLSHKVLRWITPFFLLVMFYMLLLKLTLLILIVTLFLPIIDLLLFTFDMEFKPLRRFNYFIVMNIAVFLGFLKFCKGVKSNVWQPTTRK